MGKVNSDRLKQLRKENKLRQEDVANFIGIGRTGYVRIENGERDADTEMISKLADFFNVTVDYLLGRDSAPTQDEIMTLFPGGKFNYQLFGNSDVPDQSSIQRAIELFSQMDEAHQKAALAQLEALVALNKK